MPVSAEAATLLALHTDPELLVVVNVEQLVEGLGAQRLSVIAVPGSLPLAELAALGVARVSFGPFTQRLALTALADAGAAMLAGASLPDGIRALNEGAPYPTGRLSGPASSLGS